MKPFEPLKGGIFMLVGKAMREGKKRKNLVENMGSKKSNSPRKFTRRSHTRKDTRLCFINMAEARREIVNALHLHRSTSRWGPTMVANTCNIVVNKPTIASSQQYYPLLDSFSLPPVPPTWSTTAPSLLPTLTPPPMESLEFEWPENLSSSYAWWLGFLKTLDGKIRTQVSKCPYGENIVMAHSRVLGQFSEGSTELGDQPPSLDANDQNPSPDDWLTVTTAEDQGEVG